MKINNISYKVKNSTSSQNEVDIEIYDQIGEYIDWTTWTIKGVTYESFKSDFESAIKNYDKVNIRLNCYGGDVNAGLAIYNLIQSQSSKNIHIYIDVAAYSMAAVIAQAVKIGNRHASKNATIMIHEAITSIYSDMNATELREVADTLDVFNDVLATSMSATMGMTKDDFKSKYFDGKDHLMTAEEALANNIIDDIVTEELRAEVKKQDMIQNIADELLNRFPAVAAIFKPKNQIIKIMDLNQIKDMLLSDAPITADMKAQALDVVNKYTAAKFTEEEVKNQIEEFTKPLETSLTEVTEKAIALETENEELKSSIEELKGGGSPAGAEDSDITPENKVKNFGYQSFFK